ncbi:MAG: phytanoyl-CoA dioxygenase family protein [Verrucomicrobiota bacterium]
MTPSLATPDTDITAFFQEKGYYLARGLFPPDRMAELEADFDRIVTQFRAASPEVNAGWKGPQMEKLGAAGRVIFHTHNVQQYSAAWTRALLDPAFLNVAASILGPDIVLHHTKLFQKPGGKGAPFPMHQDWSYFPSERDSMIAAIIHVSPATDDMGCLRVYPGSHRLGRAEGTSGTQESELLDRYPLEGKGAVALEAKPGDVAFFHYFTLHGSRPNHSHHVRKTVLAQLHAGNDRIEPGNAHPNERLVLSGWNHHSTRASADEVK